MTSRLSSGCACCADTVGAANNATKAALYIAECALRLLSTELILFSLVFMRSPFTM